MSSVVISGDTSGQVTLAAPAVAGTTTITAPAVSGTMSVLSPTQSMVRLNTANGYGSSSTKIRRFTNTVTNQGSDITYADSATLGASFTINTSGVYSLQYNDNFTTVTNMGWSLNTTAPTTSILAIPIAEILCINDSSGANIIANASVTVYLASGSIVRCHTSGSATGANTNGCQVTIVRVI
jgi:hypothetical protein